MEDFAGLQARRRHNFFTPESPFPTTSHRDLPVAPTGLQIGKGGVPQPLLAIPVPAMLPPAASSDSLGMDRAESSHSLARSHSMETLRGAVLAVGPANAQPADSSAEEMDLDTELKRMESPPGASTGRNVSVFEVSMRGSALEGNPRGHWRGTSSDASSDGTGAVHAVMALRRSTFSLRGELMHA